MMYGENKSLCVTKYARRQEALGDHENETRKPPHRNPEGTVIQMEIITRTFTTNRGEPASAWQVRITNGDETIDAGQVTRTDSGYVVERAGGRRYTYRTAARAAQAMREHIAERWPDELTEQPVAHPETEAVAAAESVLELLKDSHEISALVEMLADVQRRTEATGTWSTPQGRAVEYALGHLRLALEAPGLSKLPA